MALEARRGDREVIADDVVDQLAHALAVIADQLGGDLTKVRRVVRLGVFVQSDDRFDGQPKVANGASEFMQAVFGEAGRHARAAVGTNALPLDATVEVEVLVEVV